MKYLKKLAIFLNAFIAILTLFSYLSTVLDTEQVWIFAIPGLFYPILLLLNIGFIIIWLLSKPKYIWISVVVIILGIGHIGSFINFNTIESGKKSDEIKVLSYNIQNASSSYSKNKKIRKKKEKQMIQHLSQFDDLDVMCFQEVAGFSGDLLQKTFGKINIHQNKLSGPRIYTKHPIVNKGSIDFKTVTNGCIWADVVINLDTIRIYNVHLQSNRISENASKVLEDVNFQEKETWDGFLGILKRYKKYNQIRSKQLKLVKKHYENCSYPILLTGDFNDTPQSFIYSELKGNFNDSFVEKGNGIGTTFAGNIPLLRIDYILGSNQIEFLNHEVVKKTKSDHYPIKVTLRPRNQADEE